MAGTTGLEPAASAVTGYPTIYAAVSSSGPELAKLHYAPWFTFAGDTPSSLVLTHGHSCPSLEFRFILWGFLWGMVQAHVRHLVSNFSASRGAESGMAELRHKGARPFILRQSELSRVEGRAVTETPLRQFGRSAIFYFFLPFSKCVAGFLPRGPLLGVSVTFAVAIREGYRPHPRHWEALAELVSVQSAPNLKRTDTARGLLNQQEGARDGGELRTHDTVNRFSASYKESG